MWCFIGGGQDFALSMNYADGFRIGFYEMADAHFAMTGMVTAFVISSIFSGRLCAPPALARISAGTRSSAITISSAASAILACSCCHHVRYTTPPFEHLRQTFL